MKDGIPPLLRDFTPSRDVGEITAMLKEFHAIADLKGPSNLDDLVALRRLLVAEEAAEVDEVLGTEFNELDPERIADEAEGWLCHLAKELADDIYVIFGTGVALGIDLDDALRRVHASNMSKFSAPGGGVDKKGKINKGDNYEPPKLNGSVKDSWLLD